MQSTMIVSQQRYKIKHEFLCPSTSSQNTTNYHLNDNGDKSSDEKKSKDLNQIFNSVYDQKDEKFLQSTVNENSLSPLRYRHTQSSIANRSNLTNRDKKSSSWFNFLPSYKVRAEEFKRHFGHIVPSNERFIVDYSCAYHHEILRQGRMYISLNYICFYANILSWQTNLVIKFKEITQIYKTNTALIIPNAIEIVTDSGDKYFFASFVTREKAFLMLQKIWQNATQDIKLNPKDLLETNKEGISEELIWNWIHEAYGHYLGYTEEEEKHQKSIRSTSTSAGKQNKLVNDSDSSSDSDIYLDSDTFNEMNDSNKQTIVANQENDTEQEPSFSCCCEEHDGTEIFNETFPLTVDQMFTLAFDDSPFYRMMQKQRKSTVLVCEPWRDVDEVDNEETNREKALVKTRQLKLRVQVDSALAKSVEVREVQFLDKKSMPGYYYMINSKAQNSGAPFADTFQVFTQFCFSRGSTVKECNLIVHVRIEFVKSSFGLSLVKGKIESSSINGVADYCKFLSKHLNNWCKEKSLERRQNLSFQQYKLQYDSSNEDNDEDNEDDDDDFVLSNENMLSGDDFPLIKTNSINRKVFDGKRKRFKSSSISTLGSGRIQLSKHNGPSPFWKFKTNELILFIIFIILLLILILILFLFKRLWQLEIIIRKYEEDLISFERFIKLTSNLSREESFMQFFNQSNSTVLNLAENWKDLINQTESTIKSIKSIYLDKLGLLEEAFDEM